MAVLPGSPPIVGVPGNTPGTPATDQRGFSRNTAAATDIGAFEVQPTDSYVALTASTDPSVYGQWVTLIAAVSLTLSGTKATAGTLTFLDGSTVFASGWAVSGGQATISTAALTAGTQTLLAVYSGASGFLPAAAVSQVVKKADLYVTATANSKTYGQTASDSGTLTGVVIGDGITATFSSPGR
jgi:hypothetical protein